MVSIQSKFTYPCSYLSLVLTEANYGISSYNVNKYRRRKGALMLRSYWSSLQASVLKGKEEMFIWWRGQCLLTAMETRIWQQEQRYRNSRDHISSSCLHQTKVNKLIASSSFWLKGSCSFKDKRAWQVTLPFLTYYTLKCYALRPIGVLHFSPTWLNQHLVGKVTSLALEFMSSGVAEFWLLTELCDSIPERGENQSSWFNPNFCHIWLFRLREKRKRRLG